MASDKVLDCGITYELHHSERFYEVEKVNPLLEGQIYISAEIEGLPVMGIKKYAFAKCRCTWVILPDSITIIEKSAFRESDLIEIVLPENLRFIEAEAFKCCKNLQRIKFNSDISHIGSYAFAGCNSLHTVEIKSLESWLSIKFDDEFSNPLIYSKRLKDYNQEPITCIEIKKSIVKAYSFFGCCFDEIRLSYTTIFKGAFNDVNCERLTLGKQVFVFSDQNAFNNFDTEELIFEGESYSFPEITSEVLVNNKFAIEALPF